jgi:hypothetical protein
MVLLALGLTASGLQGQSIVRGSMEGSVRSVDGEPVGSAALIVRPLGTGLEYVAVTGSDGTASLSFMDPGSYELLVEALGYRPVLVTPLDVPVGDRVHIEVELTPAEGVVAQVDTVAPAVDPASRWTAGGARLRPGVTRWVPTSTEGLAEVAPLVTALDRSLGVEGLPASETSTFIDGVPFAPARLPGLRGQATWSPILARSGTSWLRALLAPGDVEWTGGGGVVAATTRNGGSLADPVRLEGGWSGSSLWSSTEHGFTSPDFTSLWGSGHASIALVPDTSHLFLSGDGMVRRIPRPARLSADAAAQLGTLDEALVQALSLPSIAETRRVTGLARLDWRLNPTRRLGLRAAVGHLERTLEGQGLPLLAYGRDPASTGTDFSVVADLTTQPGDRLTVELRGGVSGSSREVRGGDAAQALVVEDAALLGGAAGSDADISRLDLSFLSAVHYQFEGGSAFKAGGQVRATRHTSRHTPYRGGRFVYPELSDVPSGVAAGIASSGPEVSFSGAEAAVFAQYLWAPNPGLRFTFGGRLDYETISSEARPNEDFRAVTGIDNTDYPERFLTPGFGASATWDLTGGAGRVLFLAAGSVQSGDLDPAFLHEVFASSQGATVTRFVGADAGWPGSDLPGDATGRGPLSLLGPDTRPPQHVRVHGGILARIGPSTSLYVGGSARRTDFLLRRRDLNLSANPAASDPFGRPIVGALQKEGGLVTLAGDGHRRFSGFDAVWALDPDGYSTHRAATVGLEHRRGPLELAASYTRSVTEDNWLGAGLASPETAQQPGLPDQLTPWAEGTSDFDVPDRLVASARVALGDRAAVGGVYRYASGRPFTPGYRWGVDANGDGSGFNDPAFVPSSGDLGALTGTWSCLQDMAGDFAVRNGCRGEGRHGLDLRLELRLADIGGLPLQVVVDGFNVVERTGGLRDTALLLVDPDGELTTSDGGGTIGIPVSVNPDFGRVLIPDSPGTFLRVGVRLGGR